MWQGWLRFCLCRTLALLDDSESLVEQYLIGLDRGVVVFEPDGNIPPDFSLAGTIGVEVRRLNQNYEQPDGSVENLEKSGRPTMAAR